MTYCRYVVLELSRYDLDERVILRRIYYFDHEWSKTFMIRTLAKTSQSHLMLCFHSIIEDTLRTIAMLCM